MRTCKNCGFENRDLTYFCVKCGASLDKRCPNCNRILAEEDVFCPGCGARVDGRINCPNCRELAEKGDEYCGNCGAPLTKKPKNAAAARPQTRTRAFVTRILNITRAGLVTAFALVMFILSFFGVHTVDATDMANDLFQGSSSISRYTLEVSVSSIDIIEGAFSTISPKNEQELVADLENFARKHLSDEDYEILKNLSRYPNTSEALRLVTNLLNDYNILKMCGITEFTENFPNGVADVWAAAVYSLGYILLSGTFLILSIIDLVFTILGKEHKKGKSVILSLFLGLTFGYLFVLKEIFEGAAGGALIAVLVLGILAFLIEFAYKVFAGGFKFTLKKLPLYISAGAGVVLTLIVVSLLTSSLLSLSCTYSGKTFTDRYSAESLASAWSNFKIYGKDEEILGHAAEYIPSIFQSYFGSTLTANRTLLKESLSPAMMGLLGDIELEVALAAVGEVTQLVCLGTVIALGFSVAGNFRTFEKNEKVHIASAIVSTCFTFVLLGLGIAYMEMVNATMAGTKEVVYKTSVSGVVIAACILSVINLAQKIVCRVLVKRALKKEKI